MKSIKIYMAVKRRGEKDEEFGIVLKETDLEKNPHDLLGFTMVEIWEFIKKSVLKNEKAKVHFDATMEDGMRLTLQ